MKITNNTNPEEVKVVMKNALNDMCSTESSFEKSTTGEEIRKIMRIKTSSVAFNEQDFIKLLLSKLLKTEYQK
ncbi:MAG: hypothetical protein ACLSBH_20185 [Coprobacillus cateniformis]